VACNVQGTKHGFDPGDGPQTVSVWIKNLNKELTVFIHVDCHASEI
jgi:hypothetical protein